MMNQQSFSLNHRRIHNALHLEAVDIAELLEATVKRVSQSTDLPGLHHPIIEVNYYL